MRKNLFINSKALCRGVLMYVNEIKIKVRYMEGIGGII